MVKIDDADLYQSPNRFEGLKTTVPFKFSSKSENSEGEVISNPLSSTFFIRYKVFVNGSEIDSGRVVANNWYKFYGLLSLIMLGVFSYESIVNSFRRAWMLGNLLFH